MDDLFSFASRLEAETKAPENAAMEDTNKYVRRHSSGTEGSAILEQPMHHFMDHPYVLIRCRSLRIGSYKAKPAEPVVFSSDGLGMMVPHPSGEDVNVRVAISDIVSVLVSYCRSMPVLFIHINGSGGVKVRKTLDISESNNSLYFDPESSDDTHKHILLLPEKISEDFKVTLQKILGSSKKLLTEISNAEANDILVKSSSSNKVESGSVLLEQAIHCSVPHPCVDIHAYVLILCRSLRIGTYKTKPTERVVISLKGLEMKVPHPSGQDVNIRVAMSDIVSILVSFCRFMPVLFIYIEGSGGAKVRKTLHMNESNKSYYFNPESSDDTHKCITLLPEKIGEDFKITLQNILASSKKILTEISNSAANEILVKSTPPTKWNQVLGRQTQFGKAPISTNGVYI